MRSETRKSPAASERPAAVAGLVCRDGATGNVGSNKIGHRFKARSRANPLRFMFRKLSDIGQHSGTLCALQTATGGLRCPGLKQRPQALFGLGALWRLACPNFRLSQRPLSLSGLGIATGQRGPWRLSEFCRWNVPRPARRRPGDASRPWRSHWFTSGVGVRADKAYRVGLFAF